MIADVPLFDGILRDLFPNTPAFAPTEAALEAQVVRECERLKLQPCQYMLDKIRQVRVRSDSAVIVPLMVVNTVRYFVLLTNHTTGA